MGQAPMPRTMSNASTHRVATVGGIILARLRFVFVFLAAALVVGYWDNIQNHWDKWTRPAVAPDALAHAPSSDIEYYCPMHPQVIRSEPGQCPKCGMPLVKRKRGVPTTLPADVLARVQLTPQRVALANVQTTAVEPRELTRTIEAVGVLDYDETKLSRLSARVAGRADELFVTFTGQSIQRGEPIYSLYSPEVYTAQREYLLARKRVNEMPGGTSMETRNDATAVYNASLQKLALWGMTSEQLDRLDHEFDETGKIPTHLTVTSPIDGIVVAKRITQGQYLSVGDSPYTVADLSDLWLQVKLYERDIALVHVGDPVTVRVEALGDEAFDGVVAFMAYALDTETRTLDARVVVPNPNLRLRPGMFGSATVHVAMLSLGPTSQPVAVSREGASKPSSSSVYWAALQPYLAAHKLLSSDKADGVSEQLEKLTTSLKALHDPAADRVVNAVAVLQGQSDHSLPALRESWKEISAGMIELGKRVSLPSDAPTVKVFRCPMKKANWLQLGDETANPYYGSEMYNCGSAVESLPKATQAPPPKRNVISGSRVLAIPRSAVIETGDDTIVYVESSPGIYDMKSVKLGRIAGAFYPVISGLEEGDRVVTVGAFLIDAENRLNPTREMELQMHPDEHR
jgi:multidrug efflux pump subunit AcrA (membrane-fusion protein)